LLDSGLVAQKLISGFSLKFKHLHGRYGSMTGLRAVWANPGAPVDVRSRMNTCSADG
jgi:hypothetical protein